MTCCTPSGYRTIFGSRAAEREARRYGRKGLSGSARWLAEALERAGVEGRSVLEVGGGVGGLQIELLQAGADRATNVEIIDTYESVAHGLLDLVILHRVICCYPDADVLMKAACVHARERVAITIPRESAWIRLGFALMNAWFRLRRIDFRIYVHPLDKMLVVSEGRGFRLAERHRGALWQSFVLRRA
jgi:hypothetical protein